MADAVIERAMTILRATIELLESGIRRYGNATQEGNGNATVQALEMMRVEVNISLEKLRESQKH